MRKILFAVVLCLLLGCSGNNDQTQHTADSQAFAAQRSEFIVSDHTGQAGVPRIVHLGAIESPKFAKVVSVYEAGKTDSRPALRFKLDGGDAPIQTAVYEISASQEGGTVSLVLSPVSGIPVGTAPLEIRQTSFRRLGLEDVEEEEWKFSDDVSIKCLISRGCIDTNRTSVSILVSGQPQCTLSDLGFVTFVAYDIDADGNSEALLVSNKLCSKYCEFFLIKVPK